ncbi:MAG: serine/threonine-protein kinase [Holophaga sp.]|nr:serine/threonine-protein kinase [Holophaga sp.]
MMKTLPLVLAVLAAQPQPGFHRSLADGLEAMDRGRWRVAIAALERAVQLRPKPAAEIRLHGRPPQPYCPYSLLARCHLELGETAAAAALLKVAETQGEPASAREPVARRLPGPAKPAPEPREEIPPLPRAFWIAAGCGLVGLAAGLVWNRRRKGGGVPARPGTVGPYRILRTLGHGGFATTYLARHTGTGREVALKVPHAHRLDDPEFRRRFSQEARLGALLDHPHLAPVVDPGAEDEPGWIALEYVPGPTLEACLRERGRLSLAEALGVALGVAEAMAYAHAKGVVHRDLKPANIILGGQGPKVLDLGIARQLDGTGHTTTGTFLGSPVYAAPEAQELAQAGPAADRYSLGVILFEMLAGRPPFQGQTPLALLDQHRSAPAPNLAALRDLPAGLVQLVGRLLHKEPERRPGDGELVAQLRRWGTPQNTRRKAT